MRAVYKEEEAHRRFKELMQSWSTRAVLVLFGAFLVSDSAIAADFISLGFLNPGNNVSRISGLSSDGTIAVGESFEYRQTAAGSQDEIRNGALFRWSANTGMSTL